MSYATVEKKLHEIPEEYLDLVANFIETIKFQIEHKAPQKGKGMAAAYANPDLIKFEKSAFEKGLLERYEKSLAT